MMDRQYLSDLLDFHYWARDRVLAAVAVLTPEQYARPMGSSFASVRDTLNHIYQAEWISYSRWHGESPASFGATIPDLESLASRWRDLEREVRAFLAAQGADGLRAVIAYRLMSGKEGASPLWQMVAHVVNHATYHRGQVVTLLRQLGVTPAQGTDMITFFRERRAEK